VSAVSESVVSLKSFPTFTLLLLFSVVFLYAVETNTQKTINAHNNNTHKFSMNYDLAKPWDGSPQWTDPREPAMWFW
jgi:hypothetical protein